MILPQGGAGWLFWRFSLAEMAGCYGDFP